MPVNILMPALSPTMEKGNLAKWLKKEGDAIKSGDVIAEIETDKATMEVEAVDEGVLAKITVPEGTADVPVNQVIGVIAGEGEDAASVGKGGAAFETPAPPAPQDDAGGSGGTGGPGAPQRHPEEARSAVSKDAQPPPNGQMSYARSNEAPDGPAKPAANGAAPSAKANGAGEGGRIFATPLARRLAKEAGIAIERVQGSGPHGRVVQADVQAAVASGSAKPAPAARPASATPAPAPKPAAGAVSAGMTLDQIKAMYAPGSFEEVPLDGMRKTIARRLVESKQTVPHFYLTVDVELDALLALREGINAGAPKGKDGKPGFKLSVNDFVIKALAVALQRVPDANAVWAEDRVLRFKHSDVGVAVAIEGGLFTPVIRRAEEKTLSAISAEMKDLAARARTRKLKPEEYQGGATAVSNLGMFGIKDFSAVINPPHATILAVGAGEKRVVVKNDAPAVAQVMTATLSVDHRVVDGALGAELLSAFKTLVENPMAMLV